MNFPNSRFEEQHSSDSLSSKLNYLDPPSAMRWRRWFWVSGLGSNGDGGMISGFKVGERWLIVDLVAGALLCASLDVLFERLASEEIPRLFQGKKVIVEKLDELNTVLLSANVLLNDAEEKQLRNDEVRKWLFKLQDVIYQVDDLLDRIDYEALRSKLEDDHQSSSSKLANAEHLRGELKISGLENINDAKEASKANLKGKKDLKQLTLSWDNDVDGVDSSEEELDVLDALRPHTNMEDLVIINYRGTTFSNWISDCAFSNLVSICLKDCKSCWFLPPLGRLPSLKDLTIKGCDSVLSIELMMIEAKTFFLKSIDELYAGFNSANFIRFVPILNYLKHHVKIMAHPPVQKAVESLGKEFVTLSKAIITNPNSKTMVKQVEDMVHGLGRSLGLVVFASLEVCTDFKEQIGTLHKDLYGDGEKLRLALMLLSDLIIEKKVGNDWIEDGGVILALFNRLGSSKPEHRLIIIRLLRNLALDNVENKEKMADVGFLSTLVKSLIREEEERREAVGLLLNLSELSSVRRQIGRIQGCIVMLVALLNGDDPIASIDAGKLLNLLSSNTQNALHMAEAGYFKPLVKHLKEGSDMSKILMATALSRIELTDQSRASLGEDGAIEPLVRMFTTGKLEAKLSALNALQNLSSLAENVQRLIHSSILSPLLQLLFSVTSVLMTLREPASAILAKIAESESILVNQDLYSAQHGVIPLLVKLLSSESSVAKHNAATSLAQLSQNSLSLRKPKAPRWFCTPPSASAYCEVHEGFCAVKTTLCLVKAGAISPLLKVLEGKDREADEAVLGALATLLQDEIWENGSNYIAKTLQVEAIVRVLESGNNKAKEKVLWILERIFRIDEYKLQYGEFAQVLLIDLAQQGDSRLKPAIAKVLAQLELLQDQSSYF
uniref:Uncharacterized protein n=1 Tax=Cannabis sativa TaxID=3483 RepID=A0A803P6C1_CANSA